MLTHSAGSRVRVRVRVPVCAVRGYLTGSTSTSIWTQYEKGCALFLLPLSRLTRLPPSVVTAGQHLTAPDAARRARAASTRSVRNYCGEALPEGLAKNAKLPRSMLTPTTKAEDHDEPISPADIVKRGLMTQAEWDEAGALALKLFAFGQEAAAKNGLLLVDTKYEFGRDCVDGSIRLIDEVHTPDSSRYWVASTYAERHADGARCVAGMRHVS